MSRAPVFWFFLLLYLTTMSGTIASSDGHTMMLLTRSIVDRGAFDVEGGNTFTGVGGKSYPKAGLGQALLGIPLYWAASRAADWVPPLRSRREPLIRFSMQLSGPLAGAALCWVFLGLLLTLGLSRRQALFSTLMLGLATPAWVYSKTYLTEPWTSWLLLCAFAALLRFRRGGDWRQAFVAGAAAGYAVLIKVAMLLPAGALGLYLLYVWLRERRRAAPLVAAALPFAACLGAVLYYNYARFGTVGESGYGLEQTSRGFTTPLYSGLYGQLFSAGKGLVWFAPPLALLLWTWGRFARSHRAEAWAILGMTVPSLVMNSAFRAWAGDGSWGPRYLIPFVPLLLVPVCVGVAYGAVRRRWAALLLLAGLLVQWGGVSIYYGSYLREAGEYPYTRAFEDPRFLEDVHWVPNFSPIVGHWEMFRRNLAEHWRGAWPRVQVTDAPSGSAGERIALSPGDQTRMLHGIDFWFLYLIYVGAAGPRVLVLPAALLCLCAWALGASWRAASSRAP